MKLFIYLFVCNIFVFEISILFAMCKSLPTVKAEELLVYYIFNNSISRLI